MSEDLTCINCGRVMPNPEGYSSDMGNLCHPDDPHLRDCYTDWTIYGNRFATADEAAEAAQRQSIKWAGTLAWLADA